MKVCYLINQYPKVSHTFIRREILALENLGVDVTRISIRRVSEVIVDPVDIEEQKKTLFLIDDNLSRIFKDFFGELFRNTRGFFAGLRALANLSKTADSKLKLLVYFMEACSIKRICVDQGIHHLHAHFGTNPAAVAVFSKCLGGPEFSFTVHGPDEFDNPQGLNLGWKMRYSKFTVAITSFCRSQLFRWVDYPHWKKVQEVHCAVDENLLADDVSPVSDTTRLINIGRLSEQKGQMLLLEAFCESIKQGAKLHLDLVGDGDLRETMEEFVKKEHIQDHVTFHGWQSSGRIMQLLDASSVMVLPSFAEGLPVVIMESFARARPVLTTSIAGIPELVDSSCGWLVAPGDVNGLRDALLNLQNCDADTLTRMGLEGRSRVKERHNARTEAQKLKSFFEEPSDA